MSQEVTEEEKPVISEEDEASGHDDKRTVSVEDDEKERMSLGEDKEGASSEEEDYRYQSEEEEIVISQSEFLNLQTFKHICFNIKETLDQIRSHRKETILPERKEIYLSILDAAINGPYHITSLDAMSIFGISENYVERTRNLDLNKSPSPPASVRRSSSRPKIVLDNSKLSVSSNHVGDDHCSSLRLGSSHQRSHQRSHSSVNISSVNQKFSNEISKPLLAQFKQFSLHGDRKGSGTQLTLSQSDKWLKQAGVVDGKMVSTTDTAILWRRLSKSHIWMNFPEWLFFIEQLVEEKRMDIHRVRDSLLNCGIPKKNSMIEFDNSEITLRLTDHNQYPHRHRSRFDSQGNGLGTAGTRDHLRDLPMLWATPSPSGFMMTCPSVLGAGRSGATSPIQPRKYGYEEICRI